MVVGYFRIVLIGHSIGCKLIMEIAKRNTTHNFTGILRTSETQITITRNKAHHFTQQLCETRVQQTNETQITITRNKAHNFTQQPCETQVQQTNETQITINNKKQSSQFYAATM